MEEQKGFSALASRQKYWSELSSDEKIERMRREVKELQSQIASLTGILLEFGSDFRNHTHVNDRIVKPIDSLTINSEISLRGFNVPHLRSDFPKNPKNPDEVYF